MDKAIGGKPRKRRSCCLGFFIFLLFLILIAGGGFAYLYSHPISNQALHERVVRRLERISGLNVAYDSATLTIATGQYHIRNLRFTDPKSPSEPVLTVDEVIASIRPWQVLVNPESVITNVVLKNPSRLDLEFTQDTLKLGPRTKFLVDSVRKAQPPGQRRAGRLPFDELRIEDIDLAFTEKEGILPGITPPKPVMVMDGSLIVRNADENDLDVKFSGQAQRPNESDNVDTSATMASGVQANAIVKPSNAFVLDAKAEHINLTQIFREMPLTSLEAEQIHVAMTSSSDGTSRTLNGSIDAKSLAFNNPENHMHLDDQELKIETDLDVNTSLSVAQIQTLKINSDGVQAGITGLIKYAKTPEYNLTVSAQEIGRDYKLLLKRFLPADWDVQAQQNSLALDISVEGKGAILAKVEGNLAVRGVHLVSPHLPAALKNLSGDIQLSPQKLTLKDGSGEYGGARVALDGTFAGDLWNEHAGKLALNWSSVIPVAEITKLHGTQIAGNGDKITGSGTITGHGTWLQDVDFSKPQGMTVPHVEGEIEFKDVGLAMGALPAPVEKLNGTAQVSDNKLVVDHLTGIMQNNSLEVTGQISGANYFWDDSQVSASLQSKIDFSNLGPYLTTTQKANLDRYQLKGRAETEVILQGPLGQVGSQFTGKVRVSDVSVAPGLAFMDGNFTDVSGVVTWDGKTMRLDDVIGKLNGEQLAMAGDISASYLDIAIRAKPNLETVQKTFPNLGKFLQMSGNASCDLALTVGKQSDSNSTRSIVQTMEAARLLADSSVKDNTFALNGQLKFDGATIRHAAMPPARKEKGREIPAGRIQDLHGTVKINGNTFTASDNDTLSCSFADTAKCRVSGSLTLRKDDLPDMKIKISTGDTLKLDTWALGWGNELSKPPNPPMTGKHFDLDAEIVAPSVVFRGEEAGRSRAKLSFNMVQNETPRVTNFREVVVQGSQPGMGRVIGTGKIESYIWKPQQFPRWQTSLDVQSMPLEALLGAVFTDPANVRGMITGNLNVNGVGTNAHSITGQGSGFMTNLEIGKTAVIRQLGQTTGRNFNSTLFDTAQAATFEIGNGALSSRDLALQTNGLQLEMRGDYWFAGDPSRGIPEKAISGALRLKLFKSVFGSIPIIGQVADLADEVTNAFLLAFKVSGSADNPQITPIALPLFQGGT